MNTSHTIDLKTLEQQVEPIRKKYKAEKNKRLKTQGNDQYIRAEGNFSFFVDDPYIDATINREAITKSIEVAIIGAGFGGILSAVQLQKQGIDDVCILDKAGDFGGAWYWNRYPGLACDMKSYVYLPLLEETGYMPPRNYATGEEIRTHAHRIVEHWNLRPKALLQTAVTEAKWQADKNQWLITTDRGDQIFAKHVISTKGLLSQPKLPGIKGILDYQGHTFHTSRWDFDYTGGDLSGNLTNLKGKRVGIIGTGATAAQCIPHLAESAEHLYVFQRTPSSIDQRDEQPTDKSWVRSLTEGWHERLITNFTQQTSGQLVEEDLVNDGWTDIISTLADIAKHQDPVEADQMSEEELADQAKLAALTTELIDFDKMEKIRARVDNIVTDKQAADNLKPHYRMFCKRPVFHDGYLETFNRDNVTLVDTNGQGVTEISPKGPVVNGVEYEVDCLIFASGFEIGLEFFNDLGFPVIGKHDTLLTERWKNGIETLHSMHVDGFPNLYIQQVAQGALPANFCHGLLEFSKHAAYVISTSKEKKLETLEATKEAVDQWVNHCLTVAATNREFLESCTPGYYNNEGKLNETLAKCSSYGLGPMAFFDHMESWIQEGSLDGLN